MSSSQPPLRSSTDLPCLACNKPGSLRCSNCKHAAYCSQECQKTDWKVHKILCQQYAKSSSFGPVISTLVPGCIMALAMGWQAGLVSVFGCICVLVALTAAFIRMELQPGGFTEGSRPSPKKSDAGFVRAIYFDPTKTRPEFIWLELRKESVGGDLYNLPVLDDLISKNKTDHAIEYIAMDPRTGKELPFALYVRYRDNFYNDGSKTNKAIQSIIDPQIRPRVQEWRGPMVIYCMKDIDYEPEVPGLDIMPSDLRYIVEWFRSKRA